MHRNSAWVLQRVMHKEYSSVNVDYFIVDTIFRISGPGRIDKDLLNISYVLHQRHQYQKSGTAPRSLNSWG